MTRTEYLNRIKPHYSGYQELHVHTQASYRDAVNSVDDVVNTAIAMGRQAFAITDHGNQMRLFHGFKARTKAEIAALRKTMESAGVPAGDIKAAVGAIGATDSIRNPTEKMWPFIEKYGDCFVEAVLHSPQYVPGIEMYFQPEKDPEDNSAFHIILYAMDWEGQKVLFRLTNLAQLNKNKYGNPRTTWAELEQFIGPGSAGHGHIIGTSACVGGYIPSLALRKWDIAEKQHELTLKIDTENFPYTPDDLKKVLEQVEQDKAAIKDQKALLSFARKAEKTDYAKKVQRLERKVEIERGKAASKAGQLSFDGSAPDADTSAVQAAETALMEARAEAEKAERVKGRVAEIVREVELATQKLNSDKERASVIEKSLRPYEKYQKKIEELEALKADAENGYYKAVDAALRMDKIFGRGRFFIELQDHGITRETVARKMLYQIIEETGIPATVANDVHYAKPEDKHKRDIIASLRFGRPVREIENEEGNDQLYFKTNAQMEELFHTSIGRQAIENTSRIAEMCNVYYTKAMHLPEFDAKAAGYDSAIQYLEAFCRKMIPQKYNLNALSTEKREELLKTIEERLTYELGVIEKMGYASYIAIVQDFIFYGRQIGGPAAVGPGRGSAAGSIVCFLADITDIDPLRYNLLFERFLNPERISMPDIDTDFAPSIRGKVIDYVAKKYAYKDVYPIDELKGTVCSIVTESELAARAAVRNVARVMEIDYSVSDKVAKLIPSKPGMTIRQAMEEDQTLAAMYQQDIIVKHLLDDAMLVEGIPAQTGVHAAGIIIADKPISEYAPLFYSEKDHCWVIECDMIECESTIGLLKMDFLGLKNLDIIKLAAFYVGKTEHKKVDFDLLKRADDENVIQTIYTTGDTNGVFQFEGEGIKKALVGFKPKTIDDIILMNAAYRPGPMQFIPDVTAVKAGEKSPSYIIPEMKNILDTTYGSAIYQEQIMQLFQMVGFSLGQSDIIRRAMSKKHLDEIEAAKGQFVKGMLDRGANADDVEHFWQQLLEFARYAFNRSHAAAYSVVSYYTAWLKTYYPACYLAAVLSYAPFDKIVLYSRDCKKRGISLLKPDINTGVPNFAPMVGAPSIRYGIKSIKGVAGAAQVIWDLRQKFGPCKDFRDFVLRCSLFGISSDAATALIQAGALDSIMRNDEHRREYVENISAALTACRKAQKEYEKNHPETTAEGLYLALSEGEDAWKMPELFHVVEYTPDELLHFEHELLGVYVSGNPVDNVMPYIEKSGRDMPIAEIDEPTPRRTLSGLVHDVQILHRKSDKAPMAKFVLEDETGSIDAIMFVRTYAQYGQELRNGGAAKVTGRIEFDDAIGEDGTAKKQLAVTDFFALN